MRTAMRVFLALTVFGLVAGRAATADEVADAGRAMLQKHRTSVVTVKLVIRQHFSMSGMGSEQSESPAEVTGTVIDPSGLTVVSLTATDPASLYASMMGDDDTQGLKVESTVTDAKILQDDGTEVNAKVVLRDKDFDLAFVRPETKPGEQYAFVDFTQAAQPQLLDELVVLNRLGRIANRAYAASVERVESIIEKPRTFYVPGKDPSTADLGSPVFALDGRVVGIGLLRA